MRVWPVLILLLTTLSGCTGESGEKAEPGHNMTGLEGADIAPAQLPEWGVGDYWSYKDSLGQQYSLVVAGDAGGDWDVRANDKQIARFDSWFDISFVGSIRKSDLAGQQGSERIQFFDFPLHDGKSWTTVWDGESRHVTAQGLEDGTFYIVAHVAGNEQGDKHADYVYDPVAGHFASMSFYAPNGTITYAAELTGNGRDFTGTLYEYGPVEELANITMNGPADYEMHQFEVGAEPGELTMTARIQCANSQQMTLFAVQHPEEDGSAAERPPTPFVTTTEPVMGNDSQCPGAEGNYVAVIEDPRAGSWRLDVANTASSPRAFTFVAQWQSRVDISF